MNDRARLIVLAVLLVTGVALGLALYLANVQSPLRSTLATPFRLLGTPVKLVDRMASRIIPVDSVDEGELGEVLKKRYDSQLKAEDPDQRYVDALMPQLTAVTGKPFGYRAYVIDSGGPNAMALPGGIIFITRPLLDTLQSESELVSIMAHEVGHIEIGHCFDSVKFRLLAEKFGARTLAWLADFAVQLLMRHSFSKTQEAEADDYAFEFMTHSAYDPRGSGQAFASLIEYVNERGIPRPDRANPIRDYFSSHPPLDVREANYRARAGTWWRRHPGARRAVGEENLRSRQAFPAVGELQSSPSG